MTKKLYQNKNCDLSALSRDIQSWFASLGYEIQLNNTDGAWIVQAQKADTWRKAVGATRAFNILIQGLPNEFSVDIGIGEWVSNLAAGGIAAVLTGGMTLLGSGLAAGWSKKIEMDLWNFVEQKVIFGEKVKSEKEVTTLKVSESIEQKLKALKEAFDQGFIDDVTYQAKKAAIENQGIDHKKNAELDARLAKLKSAFDSGILTQSEYKDKKAELLAQSSNAELDNKLAQLKTALSSGILTQAEFEIKAAEIHGKTKFSEKLKQLENARNAAIITSEEFEQKKTLILADSFN